MCELCRSRRLRRVKILTFTLCALCSGSATRCFIAYLVTGTWYISFAIEEYQALSFFFYSHHYFFPASLVRGFTLCDLLDKPLSQVLTPGTCLYFLLRIEFSFPLLVDFHRMPLTHALALSANQFF